MKMIRTAMRYPVTILVSVIAVCFFSFITIRNARIDIFPKLSLPVVYVAQPYGGLSPEQMEGLVTSYYEYHFLYITGVKYVESRSIQGAAIIKLEFNEGTDMSQAMAEVVGYVNRARAFMPPGTVPPFVTRFDAGSVPVGQLVFSSESRSLSEISDLALFKVRPMFSSLPGVSAPPPFGGNQKTVVISIDPDKIRSRNMSPDQVVQALAKYNTISPAGNLRIGDTTFLTPQNSMIETLDEVRNIPLQTGAGPAVYIGDVAQVNMGADITTSYALINGKRSVYIPVTKRADASTWDVVQRVKAALPDMQAAIPDDIKVTYAFDQSGYVVDALHSLLFESLLGAILTAITVLIFLRDARSALIVIITIPLALLSAATLLYLSGQTVNIMTLGGLALAVGILVDEATVTVENIHRHMELGKPKPRAVLAACQEIAAPKLAILLSILAVFVPALFMNGIPKAMFLPLSLAVGFSMIASFLLSQTLVPVFATRILPASLHKKVQNNRFHKWQERYGQLLWRLSSYNKIITLIFLIISVGALLLLFRYSGTEMFPAADSGQTQIRLRLPVGTRLERTEDATRKLLQLSDSIAGAGNTVITSAFIGTQPSSYPVNYIHLWTSGPNESVTRIKLNKGALTITVYREKMRQAVAQQLPGCTISFEPGDIIEQVLNLGSSNPVEIAIMNKNLAEGRKTATTLLNELKQLTALRDLQIATPLDYPAIKLEIDRVKAGQLGITSDQIARAVTTATSSSRFTSPGYWLDKSTGTAYQVQVQYPEYKMNSTSALEAIPVASSNNNTHYLSEVAVLRKQSIPGEYDRLNQQRYITITGNVAGESLGNVYRQIEKAVAVAGQTGQGSRIQLRGQYSLLNDTLGSLGSGLIIAIVVILLTMAVYFQSFRIAFTLLTVIPAVICGSLLMLLLTGQTLNIQSYMGTIMAVGVAIANAVLFISNAVHHRRMHSDNPAQLAATERMRPILMTTAAMIAGMIPMALALGQGSELSAPLAIAVIGGLLSSAITVLVVLPNIYQAFTSNKPYHSPSLDPDDENSLNYDKH